MDTQINIEKDDVIFTDLPQKNAAKKHTAGIRSEMAQEIISGKPAFLEKWALLLFLGVLLLLVTGSWFVRYPDTIMAPASLTANNAPKEIIPRQDGRLVKLLIKNDENVKEGQVIGWIESIASHAEVMELSRQLDSGIRLLAYGRAETVANLFGRRYEELGELQTSYQAFSVAWQQFNDYLVNGFYNRKKAMLQSDINTLDRMNETISNQVNIISQDITLSEESFKMNQRLLDERVISNEEYRVEKSKLLNKQASLPQVNATMLANQNQKREKQKELDELEHNIAQQVIIFSQALQTLKSAADEWKSKYTLQSPVSGKAVFSTPLQENQFLKQGRIIGYVMPADTRYYVEASLPQINFGKIDTGLQVQLRFDAYPYQEFGYVKGQLSYISKVASDSGFFAIVRLDNGLATNHRKAIQYKNGLKCQAVVITQDMPLLKRIYYNIIHAVQS